MDSLRLQRCHLYFSLAGSREERFCHSTSQSLRTLSSERQYCLIFNSTACALRASPILTDSSIWITTVAITKRAFIARAENNAVQSPIPRANQLLLNSKP